MTRQTSAQSSQNGSCVIVASPELHIAIQDNADGVLVVQADLPAGLFACTVDADASSFDWEELYVTLNIYGNVNQRTGPWDFNLLENNRPVLPAYWVYLDGRKLGLWYLNRPSSQQIMQRRFRGELAFRIHESGRHHIEFRPYRLFTIRWDRLELQEEPYDSLDPLPPLPADLMEKLLPQIMPSNRFSQGFLDSVTFAKQQIHTNRNSGFPLTKSMSSIRVLWITSNLRRTSAVSTRWVCINQYWSTNAL